MKIIKQIEDYQLAELNSERLFVNKYDLSLKYSYELSVQWKEFFFDLLSELVCKDTIRLCSGPNLFGTLQENYELMIEQNNLKIDIRDYIEITDYISFKEWEKLEGNELVFYEDEILLVHTS